MGELREGRRGYRVGCDRGRCASADYEERDSRLQVREERHAPNQLALTRADAVHEGKRLLHRHLNLTETTSILISMDSSAAELNRMLEVNEKAGEAEI